MDVREKLVELIRDAKFDVDRICVERDWCDGCPAAYGEGNCKEAYIADHLIANGVTVQDDMTELIGKGLDNIYWKMYGANKEFNDRMAGYTPSAFCAGFEYAIQLAKGLLTQLPQPPKGE